RSAWRSRSEECVFSVSSRRADGDGGGADALERILGTTAYGGQVPHLAAGARATLAIEMQANARLRQCGLERRRPVLPELAEQIEDRARPEHGRVAKRQVAHGANDLLELARRARDFGLVIRVVRPRRKLVDEERPVREQEHLDRENALEREALGDAACDL